MTVKGVVENVLAGDCEAFRDIVVDYGPYVRAYIAAHLHDSHAIDDLSQETFIAAYESLRDFMPDGDFKSWIRGIAHHKVLMHFRRVQQHGTAVEKIRTYVADEVSRELQQCTESDGPDLLDKLRRCLEEVPQDLLGIIHARYRSHEPVQGIADRLGKSPAAVSSLLFRGRKMLKACLERGA